MNRGILYVCFGKEFDETLASLTEISRKNTDLPITVLSNTPQKSSKWDNLTDINFKFFDLNQDQNREIKTQAVFHTPYKETILLDADSVIQKPGTNRIFSFLDEVDIILNPYHKMQQGSSFYKIYINAVKKTKTSLPLNIYSGGFLVFKNNRKVKDFFNLWHQYWKLLGAGREMPALACALKNSNIKTKGIPNLFAAEKKDKRCIIQHNYWRKKIFLSGENLFKKHGIPDPKADRSFDDNDNNDWEMVECP